VAEVRFDGIPLGDMPIEYVGDSKYDTRFTEGFTARIVMATMAAALGLRGGFRTDPRVVLF
jgi:hypothetical protein